VELSFIEYSSLVEAFAGRARELRKKASEIAEEHNTQEDKASYALFRLRAFIFKTGPGWSYSAPETKEVEKLMPKGIAQLRKDLGGLDKERGTYELSLEGTSFVKKEMSRLEALTQRTFLNVKPISPTKPFLTKQQEVKVYA